MGIIGFDDFAIFRLRTKEKIKILRVCRKNQYTFESPSHFLRVAVIKELRRFNEKGKEVRSHGKAKKDSGSG